MKKIALLLCAVILAVSLTSCVEHIDDPTPTQSTLPTQKPSGQNDPLPVVDPTDIPEEQKEDPTAPTNPTNPEDPTNPTDPANPEDPTEPQVIEGGIMENVISDVDPDNPKSKLARTAALASYPGNALFAGDGTVIDQTVSGNAITYRVKYTETLTLVVDVTALGDNITVTAALEHYMFSFGAGKPVKVSVGDKSINLLTPKINWDTNDKAGHSPLFSVTAATDGAASVKINFAIPYNGTYHGEKIESFAFEQEINIAR